LLTAELIALRREVKIKRLELAGKPTTKQTLQALMHDAAQAYSRADFETIAGARTSPSSNGGAAFMMYPRRAFLSWYYMSLCEPCERLLAKIEHAEPAVASLADEVARMSGITRRRLDLPTPTEARRLRIMTGSVPKLLPHGWRGVLDTQAKAWELLWLDACGDTAPKIAAALAPKGTVPVKRNQIWRLRDKLYDALARTLDESEIVAAA